MRTIEPILDQKFNSCPRCDGDYQGFPAISRRDNKTAICPNCGQEEALIDFEIFNGKDSVFIREVCFIKSLLKNK